MQQKQLERELSMQLVFKSEEQVLEVKKAIQKYENPVVLSSKSNSKLKNITFGFVVRFEHHTDMLNAKSIAKEHLNVFTTEPFIEKTVYFGDSDMKLSLKLFSSGDKPTVCKKNNETVNLKTDVNLFS